MQASGSVGTSVSAMYLTVAGVSCVVPQMEKLEVMIKLANEKNIDQVLLEFKEYAQEVDIDFVRKVRGTGCMSCPANTHLAQDVVVQSL